MQRLSILIGIGLMLVGSLAYALPAKQDVSALYPTLTGIAIATIGLICRNYERTGKYLIYANWILAMWILVWACLRVAWDAFFPKFGSLMLATDLDTIGLSCVLLFYMSKEVLIKLGFEKPENEMLAKSDGKSVGN